MIVVWMAQIFTQRSEPELFQTLMALILSEMASQLPKDWTASFVRRVSTNTRRPLSGEVSLQDETLRANEFESPTKITCRQYGGNEQVMFNKCVQVS